LGISPPCVISLIERNDETFNKRKYELYGELEQGACLKSRFVVELRQAEGGQNASTSIESGTGLATTTDFR
jgi:hypothetical protein